MDVAPLKTICRAYQLAFIVVVGQFPEKKIKCHHYSSVFGALLVCASYKLGTVYRHN